MVSSVSLASDTTCFSASGDMFPATRTIPRFCFACLRSAKSARNSGVSKAVIINDKGRRIVFMISPWFGETEENMRCWAQDATIRLNSHKFGGDQGW